MNHQINEACRLYNAALDERRSAWRMNGISLNYYDQARQLREIRTAGDCGVLVPKTLAERWHDCPACGLRLGRDHNTARNILRLAQGLGWSLQAPTVEAAHAVA